MKLSRLLSKQSIIKIVKIGIDQEVYKFERKV